MPEMGVATCKAGLNSVIYFYLFILAEALLVLEESGSNSLFSRLRLDQARSNQSKENCSVCSGGEATLQPGLTLSSRFPDSPPAPGAEPSVPTFPLPWAAGTGTAPSATLGTRQDSAHPQSPTCPRPCCVLRRARLRSPRHGQSCRQQGRQRSLPGTAGRGKRRRGRTQVCAPCPAGMGARLVLVAPHPKGSLRRNCCQGRGFPRALGHCSSHAPGGIPLGESRGGCIVAGRWVPGWAAGSASLFPGTAGQGSVPGGKGEWLQAPTCAQLVLVLTRAPTGASGERAVRFCRGAPVNRSSHGEWHGEGVKPHVCECKLVSVGLAGVIGEVSGSNQNWARGLEGFGRVGGVMPHSQHPGVSGQ